MGIRRTSEVRRGNHHERVGSGVLSAVGVAAAALTAVGCGGPTFVQTDSTFISSAGAELPEVFLDRLPLRPYRSVGIVEVASNQSLDKVIKSAQVKGKQVGCGLLVDRAIHRVSAVESDDDRRVSHTDQPMRSRIECPVSTSRNHVGLAYRLCVRQASYPAYTSPSPVVIRSQDSSYHPNAVPRERHEFICAVYTDAPATASADSSAIRPTPSRIWDSLVGNRTPSTACQSIHHVLEQDVRCEGEQCRPVLALAEDFRVRCANVDMDSVREVMRWRRQWKKEVPGEARDTCYTDFLLGVRSATQAQGFTDKCLKEREPGFLEKLILDRAREAETAPVDGQAPADETGGTPPRESEPR